MREKILELLSGKKIDHQPAFSGLIHITAKGLESEGIIFHEAHKDAQKMAKAAASTFKLAGIPSATLPLDLCLPAEAFGAELNFYENESQFPQVKKALVESCKDIISTKPISEFNRIPIASEAISRVKEDIGKDIVISGMIPGPYTLLLYLCNPKNLFIEMKKEPQTVLEALNYLAVFLAEVGNSYGTAGADFITIHDMGGSPGFIGPAKYEQFVLPAEKLLIQKLSVPRVLSVCGNVTNSLHLLGQTGADAISIDQTVDLNAARQALKDTLLFGNLDPVEALFKGGDAKVRGSILSAREAGVDAVWPGCDLVLETPIQNLQSLGQFS